MSKFTTREYKNIAKRPSPRQVRKDPIPVFEHNEDGLTDLTEVNPILKAEEDMTNLGEQESEVETENTEDEVDPREGNGVVTEVNPPGSVNGENPPLNYGSIDK